VNRFRYQLLVAASARALMGNESMEPFFSRAVREWKKGSEATCRVWEDVTAECAQLRNQN